MSSSEGEKIDVESSIDNKKRKAALAYKGIDYESKTINLLKKEQLSDEYKAVNPQGLVPAFVHDGHTLTQSGAIIEYIDEIYKSKPLLPVDPYLRAVCRQLFLIMAADTQPLQNLYVLNYIEELKAGEKGKWAKLVISNGLKAYESLVSSSMGLYSVGDNVTIADCALLAQVYNAVRWDVDMSAYPLINKIVSNLNELPESKLAHPDQQPDKQ